jgi:hypothetical protein
MQTTELFRHALLAIVAGSATVALAQYDPGATGNLGSGMGAAALGQSTLSGTRRIKPDAALTPPGGRLPSAGSGPGRGAAGAPPRTSAVDALDPSTRRRLEAEYARRIQTDGKPAADRWVRQIAREKARQDARIAAARGQPAPLR